MYPDAVSEEAAQEAAEWFEGNDVEPKRIDMSTKFVGKAKPKKVASGGGLKKGGLKGLKAKKDKADVAKAASADAEDLPHEPEAPAREEPKLVAASAVKEVGFFL